MQNAPIAECSHPIILLYFTKLQFVIRIFVLSIFEFAVLHRFYCIFSARDQVQSLQIE